MLKWFNRSFIYDFFMISGKLPITTIRFADDIFSEIDFFKFSHSIVFSLCLAINSADLEIFILRKLRNDSGFSLFFFIFELILLK